MIINFPVIYLRPELLVEPRRDVLVDVDLHGVGVDDGRRGRVLHGEEGLDGLDLGVVPGVGHRLALGRQPQRGHPSRVLTLLEKYSKWELIRRERTKIRWRSAFLLSMHSEPKKGGR